MSDQQYEKMIERHCSSMQQESRKRLAEASGLIEKFVTLAASKGVILHADSFEYIQTIGIVAKAPGIARTLLGPIRRERDGLVPFKEIASRFPIRPHCEGYFCGSDFILMAHSSYRRGMRPVNNWAPRFVGLFWQLDSSVVEKFIALDEDRVRIDVDGLGYFEADTWYGAPFDEDIKGIKSGVVKLRPPLDLASGYISSFFADVHCLDVNWSESDGIKSFQALEMKAENIRVETDGQCYFPARYLHAEFDLVANCFRHFDGAIQLFTEEEYFRRRDSDFNMTLKNLAHVKARSHKVFKINGSMEARLWVDLCCHFFAANPLVFEYFGGAYPTHVSEAVEKIRASASK